MMMNVRALVVFCGIVPSTILYKMTLCKLQELVGDRFEHF